MVEKIEKNGKMKIRKMKNGNQTQNLKKTRETLNSEISQPNIS